MCLPIGGKHDAGPEEQVAQTGAETAKRISKVVFNSLGRNSQFFRNLANGKMLLSAQDENLSALFGKPPDMLFQNTVQVF